MQSFKIMLSKDLNILFEISDNLETFPNLFKQFDRSEAEGCMYVFISTHYIVRTLAGVEI